MSEEYKYANPITVTFGTLKNSQNEAFQDGIEMTLREVRRLYKTDEDFNKLVHRLRQIKLYDVPVEED